MESRDNKFLKLEVLRNHKQNFNIISFYFTTSISYELQHLFLTFGVVRNDFFLRRYLKQSQRSLQYGMNYLSTKFLSTYTRTPGGFFYNLVNF